MAIVVASALALYVVYLLRQPLGLLVLAAFAAASVAGPVNAMARRLPRGLAIALIYVALIVVPVLVLALLVPPAVEGATSIVSHLPEYVEDLRGAAEGSDRLRELNETYDLTAKLKSLADNAAAALGDAAGALAGVGAGALGSLVSVGTVLVLSAFMVARGRTWIDAALRLRPAHEAEVLTRIIDRTGGAIGGYVGGVILQAALAGLAAFVVLVILGVPSPLPLAILVALFGVAPLLGLTYAKEQQLVERIAVASDHLL